MTTDSSSGKDHSTQFVNEKVAWPIRSLETLNRALKNSFGVSLTKLDRKKIARMANVEHVHEAFGSQDQFRHMLDTLFDGFEANQNLSAFAPIGLNDYANCCLRARRECMDYVHAHPDVLNQKVEKPILITGMHRTGTTLLFNLMHQDERSRSTFFYEMYGDWPHMPSAMNRAAHYTDPRMASLKRVLDQGEKLFPEGMEKRTKAHPATHDMIEEDSVIVAHQAFWHAHALLSSKAYKDLLFDNDKDFAFKYLKIYLQMLQTGYAPESHWTLKAPSHMLHIDSFMKTFPDARVVVLHRSPKSTIPSASYLFEGLFGACWQPNTWERRDIGAYIVDFYRTMTGRLMQYRDAHPEKADQFMDIQFSALEADPIGTVQSIHRKFGLDLDDATTEKMQLFLSQNKKHKHGKPDYSLELYGVPPSLVETELAPYIARYLSTQK